MWPSTYWACRGRSEGARRAWVLDSLTLLGDDSGVGCSVVPAKAGIYGCLMGLDRLLTGNSPRRATYFSLSRKRKVGKRKATPLAVSPALRSGAACDAQAWGGTAKLTARLRRAVRTTAASQSTKHGHASLPMPAPCPALLGTARGGGQSARTVASLGLFSHYRKHSEAERSDGPYRFQFPSGCAEERSGRGERMHRRMHSHRDLTRCGCPNGAAKPRSEFCGAPRTRAPQVARSEAEGRSQRGALLLPTFLVRARKVGAPPGAHPGQQRILHQQATVTDK